jgi:hypothetical protein
LPLSAGFSEARPLREDDGEPYQSLTRWHNDCVHPERPAKGVSMIAGMATGGSSLRPAQTSPSRTTFTPTDALPAASANESAAAGNATQGISVSALKKIDTSGLTIISISDNPELRDLMATNWLEMQAAQSTLAVDVPDNAPQNIYATVKVNGKVVATLYNGGTRR